MGIGNLKSVVYYPALAYLNNQLIVVGGDQTNPTDVQYFDLTTYTSGLYTNTINPGNTGNGLYYPGMYVVNQKYVSIFGGSQASTSCIQQKTEVDNLASTWQCLSTSKSTLEGL